MQGSTTGNMKNYSEKLGLRLSILSEREGRSQTEMGLSIVGKTQERHYSGVSRGLCVKYNG